MTPSPRFFAFVSVRPAFETLQFSDDCVVSASSRENPDEIIRFAFLIRKQTRHGVTSPVGFYRFLECVMHLSRYARDTVNFQFPEKFDDDLAARYGTMPLPGS
jgi:hypothetical protein